LLPDGKLRHYIKNPEDLDDDEFIHKRKSNQPMFYDHENGKYCMDKAITPTEKQTVQYAMVCSLEKVIHWTDPDFLLKKIINPIFHGIAIIILLIVAIIYFVLPTLR
jgi:G protein-coupled receptor Mth (Methuselah protein)